MPYLRIQTNLAVDEAHKQALLSDASALVAKALGKPESYVMVSFAPQQPMSFAGSDAPCAYLELKSIGLSDTKTPEISAELCKLLEREMDIPASRIYIEFADAPRAMWGWKGATF